MARLSIILAVTLFCFITASEPDPRMLAAIEALDVNHRHELAAEPDGSYYCPMDPDIRSVRPGRCSRCGMTLIEGAPDLLEYPLTLTFEPAIPRIAEPTRLIFALTNPRSTQPVRDFLQIHEKLYHAFVVSADLSFFVHDHPQRSDAGDFYLDVKFPKPGLYRVLSDFYPRGGTPQLVTNTVIVPGREKAFAPAHIQVDVAPKQGTNAYASLAPGANEIIAGQPKSLTLRIGPLDGLEPYLGAWGHMLAASSDLIDIEHHHPTATFDRVEKEMQFDLIFPRAGLYRIWVQFQRKGVVNTVAFNVPVAEDRSSPLQ
jgi:hypothetical protein